MFKIISKSRLNFILDGKKELQKENSEKSLEIAKLKSDFIALSDQKDEQLSSAYAETFKYRDILRNVADHLDQEGIQFEDVSEKIKELKEDYATATEAWGHNFKKLDEEHQITKAALSQMEMICEEHKTGLQIIQSAVGCGNVPFEALLQEIDKLKKNVIKIHKETLQIPVASSIDGLDIQQWKNKYDLLKRIHNNLKQDFFKQKEQLDNIGDMQGSIEKLLKKNMEYEQIITRACIEIRFYRFGQYGSHQTLSGYLTNARYGHLNEEILCERKRLESVVLGQNKSKKTVKMNVKNKK